mmetsp:Transcript_16520/g.45752  ORF Transcript_16520/g.45752 Transcript_16520/m.45752 type:complete len:290 (-) Transcript_16520:460-1329(-)
MPRFTISPSSLLLASVAVAAVATASVNAFIAPRQIQTRSVAPVWAKGFGDDGSAGGNKKVSPLGKSKQTVPPSNKNSVEMIRDGDTVITNPYVGSAADDEKDLSMGKRALDQMRRDKQEQQDAELRRMKEVKDVDQMLRDSPQAAAIPERVAQRMGKRMLPFVGVPLFGGMAVFVGFWYMATYRDLEFEPALVAASTIVILVVGLLGITYSVMSASWDEDREGSFLGGDEFQKNVDSIKDGLSRSRENARLRDQMISVPDAAFDNLDKKEEAKAKKSASFVEKMGDELD